MRAETTKFEMYYEELKDHTMIPKQRFIENLTFAESVASEPEFPSGSVVECGVWRGGMAAGFLRVFGPKRSYLLFDSFEGLPPPGEKDGEDARWWKSNPAHPRYFNNCKASENEVKALLSKEIFESWQICIVKGWYADTLPKTCIEPVAFIHLDSDWYQSTFVCLQRFWNHILPGGAIIIDDYFDWEGCRRAVHDFLSIVSAREAIERVGVSGGALIRRCGPWSLAESPHLR